MSNLSAAATARAVGNPGVATTPLSATPVPTVGAATPPPPVGGATASRTATDMCFQAGDVRTNLGFNFQQSECPITLTLTCEGVILYDHIPWSVCH